MPGATVVDHPLASDLLGVLRDASTPPAAFRVAARRLGRLLVLEATSTLRTRPAPVETPVGTGRARRVDEPVAAVAVLRAGLGLLDAVHDLHPDATVGFVGLERDHETLQPREYYRRLPDVAGALVLVLEPMLATGGSASWAVRAAADAGAARVAVVSVVAATPGVERLLRDHPDVAVVTAGLDERLDERGYIVPGLGDFGDRLFGTPH